MTKYLVLVLVLLLVIWLGKSSRRKGDAARKTQDQAAQPRKGMEPPQVGGEVMSVCAHCGLHLPRSEALPGRGGVFCSEAHRAIVESRDGRA